MPSPDYLRFNAYLAPEMARSEGFGFRQFDFILQVHISTLVGTEHHAAFQSFLNIK
jgi:hypothetical protein